MSEKYAKKNPSGIEWIKARVLLMKNMPKRIHPASNELLMKNMPKRIHCLPLLPTISHTLNPQLSIFFH
jgi:hypothetical protein